MAKTIKCEICGELFQARGKRAGTARFCSNACRGRWISECQSGSNSPAWRGGPVTLICEYCEQPYQRGRSVVKGSHFCSRECCDKGKVQRSHVELICEQCGKPFQCPVWHADGRRFCPACYQRWLEEHRKLIFTCEHCGREFKRQPHQANTAQFCSRSCLARSRTGSKAANWQGGKSFEPYPIAFSSEFKRQIRKRDDHQCAVCRLSGNCVHHIDYNKRNTKMENCIVLCTSCHGTTNANRGYWQDILAQMVSVREVTKAEMQDPNWPT